jgi:hypothetical protein
MKINRPEKLKISQNRQGSNQKDLFDELGLKSEVNAKSQYQKK